MPWYVKIETGIVEKAIFDRYVSAHLEYIKSLNTKGHKAQSGYWAELGGGMLLFEASELSEAQAIVAADPLIANGCVKYELHEWRLVAGDILS
jgi:uncharacterized protein YciI